MARKLPQSADPVGKPRKRKSAADKAADELQTLDPTVHITVGGESIVVREYGFFQKRRVEGRGAGFISDVAALLRGRELEDVWEDVVLPMIGEHEDFVRYAVAEATGKSVAWVSTLCDADLEALVYQWWAQAGRFFFAAAVRRMRGQAIRAALDGSTSSPTSAATSNDSASAPSAS